MLANKPLVNILYYKLLSTQYILSMPTRNECRIEPTQWALQISRCNRLLAWTDNALVAYFN